MSKVNPDMRVIVVNGENNAPHPAVPVTGRLLVEFPREFLEPDDPRIRVDFPEAFYSTNNREYLGFGPGFNQIRFRIDPQYFERTGTGWVKVEIIEPHNLTPLPTWIHPKQFSMIVAVG